MTVSNEIVLRAPTPPMGWNSWNQVRCYDLTEQVVRDAADAIVSRGLRDAGYEYVVVDDCWQGGRGDDGRLFSHPERFPSGIPALAAYVHERGLKFGIYGVPGSETCANFYDDYPIADLGSLGRERQDAATFADWQVDFVKYDWCRADETDGLERPETFRLMREALDAGPRKVVYGISEYGVEEPWTWGRGVAHQWRTTQDIQPTWESIVEIIDAQAPLAEFAGPGGWNDPDMLQFGNGDLSSVQNRSHLAMWCMLAAPLFLGTDVAALSDADIAILTDPVLIRISQDPLGRQARRVFDHDGVQVWARALSDGTTVVALFNPSKDSAAMPFDALDALFGRVRWETLAEGARPGASLDAGSAVVEAFGTRLLAARLRG